MPRSIDIGTGLYGAGRYLSVWSMVDGYPRCPAPALVLGTTAPVDVAAQIAVNRAVAAICARAERAGADAVMVGQAAPPETILAPGPDGEVVEAANPAHAAWIAATERLASAALDADFLHLLRTRADALAVDAAGVTEPGWVLSLPPVPALDPVTQTADWEDGAWVVRYLTGEEAAIWPLRPPPVPDTVTRTQLRLALRERGKLEDADALVASCEDMEVVERWGAGEMERASPHLNMLAPALGLTAGDVDDLFRLGATL